jgi:signal transduction histidine kinase/DNA-binding response OmpR family regulator
MKRLVLITLLFCGPLIFVSGQSNIDPLIRALDQTLEDTSRVKLLIEISNHFRTSDYDSAIHYLDELVFLAEERHDEKSLAIAYYYLGNALSDIGSLNSSIEYYNRSLDLYEAIEDSSGVAQVYNSIGHIYMDEGDNLSALNYFQKSLDMFVALGLEEYLPYLLQNLGIAHDKLGEHELARKNHLRALHMLIEAGDTIRVFGSAYLNMGENYELTNELDLAFEHYKKGLGILRYLDNRPRMAIAYTQIGRYYYLTSQYDLAKVYADSASFLAEEQNIVYSMQEISMLYSQIFEGMGNYRSAFKYALKYSEISDQLKDLRINKQLEDFRFGREMALVEKENAIVMQRVKLTRNFAILAFILLFITLAFIYRNFRNKKRANAILAELDELKSNMFSNISHELRTPLTLILDPIEQMMEDESKKRPSERTLKTMERNTLKILGLVNQMLDLSKLDAGRLKIDLSRERILHHIKIIASSFNSLAEKKEIHFMCKYPENELETWVDTDKLDKILTNLLSNAFKYTPEGGSVSLIVSPKESKNKKSDNDADHWLYISVHDTGKGIPEVDLPKIFNRFYQVGDMDDPSRIGTGIGLALTRELTDLMKGEIVAESKMGHGTHINISLPLGRSHLNESEYSLVETPSSTGRSETISSTDDVVREPEEFLEDSPIILVVDDSEDIRMHIRDHVTGFNVLEAENGETGLKTALEAIPDLVVTDLRMPVMDGIELCKRLKEDERTSHIPVIMLTAKSGVESRLEGLETGADDYLTKPFNSKELGIRVQNLISQRQKLRELYRKEFLLEPSAVSVESADEKFLNRTRELIEEQLADPELSVEELGKSMAMSRMQLFRKIKSLTDQSPSEYIRTIRLKRAAQLIKSEYGNLAEITYEVGFNHPSYFAKCFRDLYGVAPSEYAKN